MKLMTRVVIALACATSLAMAQQDSKPNPNPNKPADSQQQKQDKQSNEQNPRTKDSYKEAGHTVTAPGFAEHVVMGGLMEIQLARLAQEKADNYQVKQLASKLEADHKQAGEELRKIATGKGYSVPSADTVENWARTTKDARDSGTGKDAVPQTDRTSKETDVDRQGQSLKETGGKDIAAARSSHMENCQRLKTLSGKEFDREYVRMTIASHKKCIEKFESASQSLQDVELKNFASKMLPKLREHLAAAQAIAPQVGATESASLRQTERQ